LKDSTTIGRIGRMMTSAASPVLIAFGFSSTTLFVRRSILFLIVSNLHAMWHVWQSRTGA